MNELIRHNIPLKLKDGTLLDGAIERRAQDQSCWISLSSEGILESATGTDYFESFCEIRRKLIQDGMYPLCYGASRNVWPSGMARDMGQGLRAYQLTIGQPGSRENLVGIFESGSDIDPVSPDDQKAFAMQWIASLQSGR